MKYRVKKRWTVMSVALISVLGLMVLALCFYKADDSGYQDIQKRANPILSLDASAYASQKKFGIRKEFWRANDCLPFLKEDGRFHAIVNCSESELSYQKLGGVQTLIENMKDVHGLVQEELFYLTPEGKKVSSIPDHMKGYAPKQAIRSISAEVAKYNYSNEILDTDDVTVKLYTVDGHELPETMLGYEPEMTLQNNKGKFEVKQVVLKEGVIIRTKQLIANCDEVIYDGKIITLLNHVELDFNQNQSTKIFCEKAVIYSGREKGAFSLEKIIFSGKVHLTNREGAILQDVFADRVVYEQNARRAHFFGYDGERVLLYDKVNDLEVSAPEIVMEWDSHSKNPQFKGVGDVRFQFAEKEYDRLKTRLVLEKERSHAGR